MIAKWWLWDGDICSGDVPLLSSHDLEVEVLGDTCVAVTTQGCDNHPLSVLIVTCTIDNTTSHNLYWTNNDHTE